MNLNRNTDIPSDLEDCVYMLKTLDMIEGKKLDNRAKLTGCIEYLKDLLKGESR